MKHVLSAFHSIKVAITPHNIDLLDKPLAKRLNGIREEVGQDLAAPLDRLLRLPSLAHRGQLAGREMFVDLVEMVGSKHLNVAKWSLSHSQLCASIAYSFDPLIASIGIDTEPSNRVIDIELGRFFLNSADCFLEASMLDKWVVKEAVLKCIDQFRHEIHLPDVVVQQLKPDCFYCTAAGEDCWAFKTMLPHKHQGAIAFRLNNS